MNRREQRVGIVDGVAIRSDDRFEVPLVPSFAYHCCRLERPMLGLDSILRHS